MKYIKKVEIENFQSHKDTTIEFDRSLNIIVGASDSGKTAILRAIKWALYNDPSGDYFIREGETESSVTISFSDKTKIKRFRSRSKNIYFTYDQDGNERKFEGFGLSVPEEVLDITGIKKIFLDKDTSKSINISDQLEGAFLLSEKNSIKANSIGYLVGVDIIDDALRDTLRDTRNLSNQQRHLDEERDILEEKLKEYDYLEEMNNKLVSMDKIRLEIKEKSDKFKTYKKLLDSIIYIKAEKKKAHDYIDKLKDLHVIEINIKDFELKYNRFRILNRTNDTYDKLIKYKKYSLNIVTSLENISRLDSTVWKIEKLETRRSKLSKLRIKVENTNLEKKQLSIKLEELNVLNKITPNLLKIKDNMLELEKLKKLKEIEGKISKSLHIGRGYLNRLEDVSISEEKYNILTKKSEEIKKISEIKSSYNDIKERKVNLEKYIKDNKDTIYKLSTQYREILLEKGRCPLCFSEIDTQKADHIIEQYN